jgi:hypothetical protein
MVFVSHEVAERLRQRRRCSRDAMYRQIRRACQDLVQRPPTVLVPDDTDLVLIVDGLWFAFQQREWVLYNMALRPIAGDRACFLDPILLEGKECAKRWRQALALSISRDRFRHIRAFVTDGFRGASTIATNNGWVLQRCHWHLLSALRGFVTGRKKTTRWRRGRRACSKLVREALRTPNEMRAQAICHELTCLTRHRSCPTRLRYVVGDFISSVNDFRAYLQHPELRLPRTISPMESKHAKLREAANRIRTPTAVLLRARSLLRLLPTIRCQPPKTPQN